MYNQESHAVYEQKKEALKACEQKEISIVSLGNASELTLGSGESKFENFGCKYASH